MTDITIGRALWTDLARQVAVRARVYNAANFHVIGRLGRIAARGPANVWMHNSDALNAI